MSPLSFDRVAAIYDTTRALPRAAAYEVTREIARTLREIAPAPRLLEIGIGTGRIAVPLAEAGIEVVGVDVARQMLAKLRAKQRDLPVVIADACSLPFPRSAFDAALLVHVLHLVPNTRAALDAAAASVRPGGALLLGRTDYLASPRRAMIEQVRDLTCALTGVALPAVDWHGAVLTAFHDAAASNGSIVTQKVLARWEESSTGRDLLAALEERVYSSSWQIPDEVMPELVRRLTPVIEERLGGLDRAVASQACFTLEAFSLPPPPPANSGEA